MVSDKAIVSPKARIGHNVTIYPFAYIEDDVEIGDDCIIYPYVSVMRGTILGQGNKIHQNTVLGALPQDFRYKGEMTQLVIGNNNIIRENVVINRATFSGNKTLIGDRNFIMEGVHIAHDTVIGNDCVFGYGTKVAGDCQIHDGAIFSSSVIINPQVRIGRKSMIQSGSRVSKDVPPFIVAGDSPVKYCGVNGVVLTNANIGEKAQAHIANAYRLIFHGQTGALDAIKEVEQQVPDGPEIREIISFVNATKLGLISKL